MNLATGAVTLVGPIGLGSPVTAIAVAPELSIAEIPSASGWTLIALAALLAALALTRLAAR